MLAARVAGIPLDRLAAATSALNRSYRATGERPSARGRLTSDEVLAYGVTRLPATLAANRAVLEQVAGALPGYRPLSHLDLGCGPGAALLAAAHRFPSIHRQVGFDREVEMLGLARAMTDAELVVRTLGPDGDNGDDGDNGGGERETYDLVTAAYCLGELDDGMADAVVSGAWQVTAPGGVLVLVEPGTPAGSGRIRRWRSLLLAGPADGEGHLVAPCPHDVTCPIAPPDWCHFSVRVERSPLHRRLKAGTAPFEDEPFSYVAVSRGSGAAGGRPAARVIRHPWRAKGRVELVLCTEPGTIERVVVRRNDAAYAEATRLRWGSPASGPAGAPRPRG